MKNIAGSAKKECSVRIVCNNKGGVGKTTTAANLGVALAKTGRKVLLIDADSQGSLTASLGYHEPDALDNTLADKMNAIIADEEFDPREGILHYQDNLDLMPANIELSGLEVSLVNAMRREFVLKDYIEMVREDYSDIIIDCMPSLGMITINALTAADSILVPCQAGFLPLKGLEQLIKTIGKVKKRLNPSLRFEGILVTMVDTRTNLAKDIIDLIRNNYGKSINVFETTIPNSVKAAEATVVGKSIFDYAPKSKVAIAYEDLKKEVLDNE